MFLNQVNDVYNTMEKKMINPFYVHQVLNNPKYNKITKCTHEAISHRVYQDVIEKVCLDCGKELDFVCIKDVRNPWGLEKLYKIAKEYEGIE